VKGGDKTIYSDGLVQLGKPLALRYSFAHHLSFAVMRCCQIFLLVLASITILTCEVTVFKL